MKIALNSAIDASVNIGYPILKIYLLEIVVRKINMGVNEAWKNSTLNIINARQCQKERALEDNLLPYLIQRGREFKKTEAHSGRCSSAHCTYGILITLLSYQVDEI